MKKVKLFTDGSCHGNPGPGGWAAILEFAGRKKEFSGADPDTTNNKMELQAVIEGLRALSEPCAVEVWTDSKYVVDGMKSWIHGWKKRGWKTADKKPVKNVELWKQLDSVSAEHETSFNWVRGHSGHPENERCDELANAAIETLPGHGKAD